MEMWSLVLFTSFYLQLSTNMFIQQKAIQPVLPVYAGSVVLLLLTLQCVTMQIVWKVI